MSKITLTDISPSDKPWNVHKSESVKIAGIYAGSEAHARKGERMGQCSGILEFGEVADPETGEVKLRLINARFCRVRYCPICQWRRSLLWRAKFYQALPAIIAQHPTARFLFLTLTVENCRVGELRETLQRMNQAWRRFVLRKEFSSVIGWVRTTEVTREKERPDYAHPHFHVLLMVPSWYFGGAGYVKHAAWAEAWKGALRADYTPVVDVRTVKAKKKPKAGEAETSGLPHDGLVETLKYSVKPSDMAEAPDWFITMTEQTHRLRFIATGGLFKDVLKPEEKITEGEMIHLADEAPKNELVHTIMRFLWENDTGYILESMREASPQERARLPDDPG